MALRSLHFFPWDQPDWLGLSSSRRRRDPSCWVGRQARSVVTQAPPMFHAPNLCYMALSAQTERQASRSELSSPASSEVDALAEVASAPPSSIMRSHAEMMAIDLSSVHVPHGTKVKLHPLGYHFRAVTPTPARNCYLNDLRPCLTFRSPPFNRGTQTTMV